MNGNDRLSLGEVELVQRLTNNWYSQVQINNAVDFFRAAVEKINWIKHKL